MDNIEFNKTLQECLINCGFILKNKNYYNSTDDLIVVVSAQKSNYDNSYYINYAIIVKDIHLGVDYPKTQEGDIRGRFQYDSGGRMTDNYPITIMDKNELQKNLNNNIQSVIKPLLEDGLKQYLEIYPKAIYTATKKLKEYLSVQFKMIVSDIN